MHLTIVTLMYCSVLFYIPFVLSNILHPGRTGVIFISLLFYLLNLVLNPFILIGVCTKDYTKVKFYLNILNNILNKDEVTSLR